MSEETNDGRKCWSFLNRAKIIIPVVTGCIVLLGVIYKLDCYNIAVHGDTVFAKDTDIAKEHQLTEAELKKLRKQMVLMQSIRNAESKIVRCKEDYRQNLLFIQQVRERYPIKEDIPGYSQFAPSGLFKEYKDAKKANEKLEVKIEEWEKERDKLELQQLTASKGGVVQ